MKILVAYDGSLNSQTALKYGIRKVKEVGGSLFALHVFNSSMFIDYGAGPNAEEMARKESSGYVEDAGRIIAETGTDISANLFTVEGNPKEEIINFARTEMIDLIIGPPRYKAIVNNAPCSVSIIPGNILLPVDNTDSYLAILDRVEKEAAETASKVLVLGIVPIHLYSKGEKKKIEALKKETETSVKKVKTLLNKKGIETKEIMRSGYPDEELLEVAGRYPLSMIIVPVGKTAKSELNKAVNIILNEPWSFKMPIQLMPAPG